jgi:hypothetical protein
LAGKVDNSLIKSGTNVDVCLDAELTSDGGFSPSDVSTSHQPLTTNHYSAEAEEKKCLVPNDNGPGLLPRLFGSVADSIAKGVKNADKAERSFKEQPDLNEFRPLWPKGEPFDKNPLELDYSSFGENAARVFGQTGIAKELAHIKRTDPARYAAIEEYFARFREIERFFTDANASKDVKLEYIKFGIERLKELAKEADLEPLYKAATAREQGLHLEYKAGLINKALLDLYITSSELAWDGNRDEFDRLLEAALKLKASMPHERDISPNSVSRERVLGELRDLSDIRKGLDVAKALDDLIKELSNREGELARSGATTDEFLDYNERLLACARKLAEFYSFYMRLEKDTPERIYPEDNLSQIEGRALYARERVRNAFKRNGIVGLAEEFGSQVEEIVTKGMNAQLLKGGSTVKIGADIVKHSAKRKKAISKGYSEGLSNEDLLAILKGLDADTNALDQIMAAAENLKKETSLYQVGEKGLIYHSRRSELYTAMTDQMAPVEDIIADIVNGSKSWSDLSELERSDFLEALARANTITANQGVVVFNNGAHRLSIGDGKLAKLCARNRIGIGDASGYGTRDIIDDLVRKGETEWAQHEEDIDNVTWRIERFEKQLRIARLEDSIEAENRFLANSRPVAEDAAKYPVLFGQVDLEKYSLVGAINEYPALPYIKWAEGTTADYRHRLNQITAKGFDEDAVSALERDVNRYFISRERNDLGYRLSEDKEYLKFRSEVWFYEGIADITLAGWAAGGVAGWVANSAKGLGIGEVAAHAFKLVPEGLLFHAGTRSSGHEGWHGPLSETEGFARSIAMLGYIGAVGKPVRAWQMERIHEMAIVNVKAHVVAGTIKAVTKDLIVKEIKKLSEDMLLRTAHSAEWFAFEYPAFQGFSAGWDLGGNLTTALTGGNVKPEEWFGRHIFEGDSWKEGAKTLLGLRLGGAVRSGVQKARVSSLQRDLADSRQKVAAAPVLMNAGPNPEIRDEIPTLVAAIPRRAKEQETPITAKDEPSKTPETWVGGDRTTPGISMKSDKALEIAAQGEPSQLPPMPFAIIPGLRANYNFIIWVPQGGFSYTLNSSTNTIKLEAHDVEGARRLLNPTRPAWDDNTAGRFIGEPREVATEDGPVTFVTLRADAAGNPSLMEIFSPQLLAKHSGYRVEIKMPAELEDVAKEVGKVEKIGDGRILLVIEGKRKSDSRIVLEEENIPEVGSEIEPEVESETPFFDTPPKPETGIHLFRNAFVNNGPPMAPGAPMPADRRPKGIYVPHQREHPAAKSEPMPGPDAPAKSPVAKRIDGAEGRWAVGKRPFGVPAPAASDVTKLSLEAARDRELGSALENIWSAAKNPPLPDYPPKTPFEKMEKTSMMLDQLIGARLVAGKKPSDVVVCVSAHAQYFQTIRLLLAKGVTVVSRESDRYHDDFMPAEKDLAQAIRDGRLILSNYKTQGHPDIKYDIVIWENPHPNMPPTAMAENCAEDAILVVQTDRAGSGMTKLFSTNKKWETIFSRSIDSPDDYFNPTMHTNGQLEIFRKVDGEPSAARESNRQLGKPDPKPSLTADELEKIFHNAPVRITRGFEGSYRPDGQRLSSFLLRQARKINGKVVTEADALKFFENEVRGHGHESLETYLMLTFGYQAATALPAETRRHVVAEADKLVDGSLEKEMSTYVAKRVPQIMTELGSSEIPPKERIGLANIIASLEYCHPEWRGHLRPTDFKRDQSEGSDRVYHKLDPGVERASILRGLSIAAIRDVFPKLGIGPDMPEDMVVKELTQFLKAYRDAERLHWDGGDDETHCGASSSLVVHLLRSKGFEAHQVWIHRYASYSKERDGLYGRTIQKIADESGTVAVTTRAIINALDGVEMTVEELAEVAADVGEPVELVKSVYNSYTSLSPKDRAIASDESGWGHHIAAVRIGDRFYLVDTNQQQFGPLYDTLLFIPVEAAAENGIIILGSGLTKIENEIYLEGLSDPYDRTMNDSQQVIREFMRIQGKYPLSESPMTEQSQTEQPASGVEDPNSQIVKPDPKPEYYFDPEQGLFLDGKALHRKIIRKCGDDVYIIAGGDDYPEAWRVGEGGMAEAIYYGFYGSLKTRPEIKIGDKAVPVKILEESGDVYLVEATGIGLMVWQEDPPHTMASSAELAEHYFPESGKLWKNGKMVDVKTLKEEDGARLLREADSNRLTAWHVKAEDNESRKADSAFFSKSSELFNDGELSTVEVVEKSGNAYVLKQSSPSKLTCWVKNSGSAEWKMAKAHYLSDSGNVFYNGKILAAKVVDRAGDTVLIEAKKYDGPLAWRVSDAGVSEPARDIYFSKSRNLATDSGRVVGVKTLARDGNFYLLKYSTPNKGRTEFVVNVDPDTGKIQGIKKHFFKDPEEQLAGDYFSPETGWCNALVVDGDLFSSQNTETFQILDRYLRNDPTEDMILVDGSGRAFESKIYPDPQKADTFWVTDNEGRARKVTANQIGNSPYYIFNLPQRIVRTERIYDGSGDVKNVYVYMRGYGVTRRATMKEVEDLAESRLGKNWPSLIAPRSVTVFSDGIPINANGQKRINRGFSWRVRVVSDHVDRFIEVRIEASSMAEAKITLDSLTEAFRQLPANLFKTVKVIDVYAGPSTKYGFTKKMVLNGQYDGASKTCSLFEISGGVSKEEKETLAHELVHSLALDRDREDILLAIAADGHHAQAQVVQARGDYGTVLIGERSAEAGALIFADPDAAPKWFGETPFMASVLAFMTGRVTGIFEREPAVIGSKNDVNPPQNAEGLKTEFELVTVANGRGSRNVEIKDMDGDKGEEGFQVVLINGQEVFFLDGRELTVYDDSPEVKIIRRVDGSLKTVATHKKGEETASYELQDGDKIIADGVVQIDFKKLEEIEAIDWGSAPIATPPQSKPLRSAVPPVVKNTPWSEDPIAERRSRLEQELAAQVKAIDGIINNFTPNRRDELLELIDGAFKTIDGLEHLGEKSKGLLKLGLLRMKREFSQVSEPRVTEIDVPADTFNGPKNRIVFGRAMPEGSVKQPNIALGDSGDEFRDISRNQLVFERTDKGWNVRSGNARYQTRIGFADIDTYKTFDVGADPTPIPSGRYEVIIKTADNVILLKVDIPSARIREAEAKPSAAADERLQQLQAAVSDLNINFYQFMEDLYGREFHEVAGVSINEAKFSIMFMTFDWQYIKGRLSKKFPGLPELIEEQEANVPRVDGTLNPPSLALDGETYYFTLKYLTELRIGRSQAADIPVHDSMVSKTHAAIIREGDKYFVVDQGSSNGTFIMRSGLTIQVTKIELLDGDEIVIGKKRLAVSMPFQRPRHDAEQPPDRSGEVLDNGDVEIEGAYPRVEVAEPPRNADDPIMSRSMVVPIGIVSERPVESEPVEIFIRGQGSLKPGKYVGFVERVLAGENWKFRFTDDSGSSKIIDPKDIVAISRRNGSESNRKLNQQFVRSADPQFKQGACNISRKGKMIIVDFRDERLTKFLEEKIRPVYDRLSAGKINKEKAAREAWAVVRKYTDYDYEHAAKGIPHYLYSLGEFVDKGVCNERGMLLQVALQYLGVSSVMEKGRFPGGRHAWVRLTDSETRELVLDPQHDKPLSPDDALFYDFNDDGTPFDLEGVKTGVISLR